MTDLTAARALTLKQPWAHAITHFGKDVENRTWAPPRSVNTLIIHAGRGVDGVGFSFLGTYGLRPAVADLVFGAIVAVADLRATCQRPAPHTVCGKWAMDGQRHWLLDNVRVLEEPVPCGGRQGLWRPTPEVLAVVVVQLPGGES